MKLEHVAVRDCDPEVTVTVPVFVPVEPYCFETIEPEPESPSVPLHE